MDVLIGIDIGTGSTKGVLTGFDGTLIARAQVTPHRLAERTAMPAPGHGEQDAEGLS